MPCASFRCLYQRAEHIGDVIAGGGVDIVDLGSDSVLFITDGAVEEADLRLHTVLHGRIGAVENLYPVVRAVKAVPLGLVFEFIVNQLARIPSCFGVCKIHGTKLNVHGVYGARLALPCSACIDIVGMSVVHSVIDR